MNYAPNIVSTRKLEAVSFYTISKYRATPKSGSLNAKITFKGTSPPTILHRYIGQ